jgi:choice-of-anchor B domain-containing protein
MSIHRGRDSRAPRHPAEPSLRSIAAALAGTALAAAHAAAQGDRVHLLSRFDVYGSPTGVSFDYNDVGGFTTGDGREVAVVGTYDGTSFVETTDPFNPVELAFIAHAGSIWSDSATLGSIVYVVNQTGDGLQVIDVSDLSNIHLVTSDTSQFTNAHNVFADESASVVYCPGGDTGMPIFDASNPAAPVWITTYTTQYVHDGSARNGLAHFGEIYAGLYRLCDVSALPTITTLDSVTTPYAFTHSAEVDPSDTLCAIADEVVSAPIAIYDLSDPLNIVLRGTFIENANGLFHNPWFLEDTVHISAYAEGYVAIDVTDPDHPRKLGSYDTWSGASGGYNGAWGVFVQPSGTVYANNIEDGLWVLCLATRIEHAGLADTGDDAGPYVVTATITPSAHGGGVTSADLHWTSDGGANVSTGPMAPTGNPDEWSASIPGHPLGSTVQYWIRATDALGTSNGPDDPSDRWVFSVGDRTSHSFIDFEAGAGGFTHGASSGNDDWLRGTPRRRGYDAYRVPSGANAFGTDPGIGSDGEYEASVSTWLESPAIDLTGVHGARLRLERWLSVEDSSKDVARVLVNGAEVWRNPTNGGTQELQDVEWVTLDLDVSAVADGVADAKVRFELTSDGSGHRGGWNVDDVELYSVSDCAPSITYGTGTAGSGGFVPQLATSGGFPYIGNPAFTVDGTQLLGSASGLYLLGFARDQSPFKGIDIRVDLTPPVRWLPITASGPAGAPAAGAFALTGDIPDDTSLLGIVVDSQVLMFDPGGPKGLAASAGLEFVICR